MVQSKAATVDDFMAEVAPERRPALDRLRTMCVERFGADTEKMAFGMPAYGRPDSLARVLESLLTQTLIIHIIRTNRIPFIQSRASRTMLFTTIAVMAARTSHYSRRSRPSRYIRLIPPVIFSTVKRLNHHRRLISAIHSSVYD